MFGYTYDPETGGLLLDGLPARSSNEPRPVYASELNILGLDSYWKYENQDDFPYMWAEASRYFYRGNFVFSTVGGSLTEKPSVALTPLKDKDGKPIDSFVLPVDSVLLPVDLDKMVEKNKEWLLVAEQTTVKKIYDVYRRRHKKLDCFHVAFSGGKDSIVLLELVKRALPASSYMVIFGDTKMEFPDTYKVVDQVEEECKKEGISFYRASSRLDPEESWRLFGPPSRVIRWCCTVHKSTPQTLKMREILKKNDYVGLDFVGVRMYESARRAEYEEECYSAKQKGQFSSNPILSWSSAEIWLYIYFRNLLINETYKKGNSRAGCLFCPMCSGKAVSFRNLCYPKEVKVFTDLIKGSVSDHNIDSYISKAWGERKNGRDLRNNERRYFEEIDGDRLKITVVKPTTDWREWFKTLGTISYRYSVSQEENKIVATIPLSINKTSEGKYFKQVFYKTAYCVRCQACEANCRNGSISFVNGVKIDNCIHCKQCHEIDDGCWIFKSVRLPNSTETQMSSLNTFADHAPKAEWLKAFFIQGALFFDPEKKDECLVTLGPNQYNIFKRFLVDAGLMVSANINKSEAKKKTTSECESKSRKVKQYLTTPFFDIVKKLGVDDPGTWGLILTQLVYNNAQMRWYVEHLPINQTVERADMTEALKSEGVSSKDSQSIAKAFRRLVEGPLGTTMHFGEVVVNKKTFVAVKRTTAILNDMRVLLYAMYRFAEKGDGQRQFTLSDLINDNNNGSGISPARLFGYTREKLEPMFRGISASYGEYLNASFTHDLEKISLREGKTSEDILKLF